MIIRGEGSLDYYRIPDPAWLNSKISIIFILLNKDHTCAEVSTLKSPRATDSRVFSKTSLVGYWNRFSWPMKEKSGNGPEPLQNNTVPERYVH